MPQKRNPIKSERIAGLARLLRGYAAAAMENQPLWHERDISHSSAERILLPDATSLLAFMTDSLNGVIDGAEIRRERMLANLAGGLGLHAASRLLTALVDAGMQRDAAYSIVQAAATSARDGNRQLHEVCLGDASITAALSSGALLKLFDHRAATVHAALLVDRLAQLETRG
jgi:adenylosuccinate lyase